MNPLSPSWARKGFLGWPCTRVCRRMPRTVAINFLKLLQVTIRYGEGNVGSCCRARQRTGHRQCTRVEYIPSHHRPVVQRHRARGRIGHRQCTQVEYIPPPHRPEWQRHRGRPHARDPGGRAWFRKLSVCQGYFVGLRWCFIREPLLLSVVNRHREALHRDSSKSPCYLPCLPVYQNSEHHRQHTSVVTIR